MSNKDNRIITSKYTLITFLPLNTYHQLCKPSNVFFLVTLILLTIPAISPFSPFSYLLAFAIVMGTSMVKDAVEDYKRHKQDEEINKKLTYQAKIENNELKIKEVFVEDLSAGDFIYIYKNQEVPADVVLLNSKIKSKKGIECKGYCFVETSSLDGESNLKKRTTQFNDKCKKEKREIFEHDVKNSDDVKFFTCQFDKELIKSINNYKVADTGDLLDKFECMLSCNEENFLCNEKNVLLRGSKIKNTNSVLAFVASVGQNTKIGKSQLKPNKRNSLFEKELSIFITGIFVIYLVIMILSSMFGSLFLRKNNIEYLYLNEYLPKEAIKQTGTNYILFSYLVPLSLFVTLEISRLFHALYVHHDEDMVSNGKKSICRNSNVTEDIGIIDYILSDKTGTITKNSMVFKYCHIHDSEDPISLDNLKKLNWNSESLKKLITKRKRKNTIDYELLFVVSLLCCNSIEPLNGSLEGISQDEVCIVGELEKQGYVLVERDERYVIIELNGEKIKCDIIMTLDFTSARQRMSVIMKIHEKYYLFSKGSDQKLLGEKQMMMSDKQRIKKLISSNSQYRSLVVGFKVLTKEKVKEIIRKSKKLTLKNRLDEEEKIFDNIENGMEYLGSTFIEDELQDEVKDTIYAIKKAGIKIWMITGDKKETALSCAWDSGIVERNSGNRSLIINGENFMDILNGEDQNTTNDPHTNNLNRQAILDYDSMVIYRATPHQKGTIAKKLIQLKVNTLAIGDGNNDVPMLLNSHVGVGIIGNEGTQASLSGDFAIPEFKFLRRLLFVHGRYNMIRFSKVTLNAFFKNIFFISVQFFYNFFNGFSGKPVYNDFFLNYYNVLFTSFVPMSIGLFDKDRPEKHCLRHPEEYKNIKSYFTRFVFTTGFIYSVIGGLLTFGLAMGIVYTKDLINHNGITSGYLGVSNFFSVIVFCIVLAAQIRDISYYVVYSWIAIFMSIFLNFVTLFFIQEINEEVNKAAYNLFSMPIFYVSCIFVLSAVMFADFFVFRLFKVMKVKERYIKN